MSKKKYYLVLDTETATLPFANDICKTAKQKQKIAIAKPLVYDIGWLICDRTGDVIKKENFLVQETFFVPNVFNTAYYCNKRPIYMNLLRDGEICAKTWNEIIEILLEDLQKVEMVTAYNAAFDFKKAIPFTETYINHLYNSDYNEWERKQKYSCENIVKGHVKDGTNPSFLKPVFELREQEFPIADLWGLACQKIINIDKYRNYCLKNNLLTASAQFFKTSAETTFQYISNQYDFEEAHTALNDAEIEKMILTKILKKGKINPQMTAFPFKELGTTIDYTITKQRKYMEVVRDALAAYISTLMDGTAYFSKMEDYLGLLNHELEKDI